MSDTRQNTHSQHARQFWWWVVPVLLGLVALGFYDSISKMVETWFTTQEYSHGVLLPMLAAYFAWQKRAEITAGQTTGRWFGMVLVTVGLLINFVARMAAVYSIQQYAMVLTIYGIVATFGGWRALRVLLVPLLLLLFMVPPPNFFMNNLSAELQLLSSRIGVLFIRLAGISVFLEGNVIDLGTYKLQVAEACSGLRYLFPLMTMGFVMAYLFKTSWWKRALVFLSSIPLTIFMNSLRIGVIGIMVEHWGIAMAEGFLHEFQGWAVFMVTIFFMFVEIMLLSRFGERGKSWRDTFGWGDPAATAVKDSESPQAEERRLSGPVIAVLLMLVCSIPISWGFTAPAESVPQRKSFNEFPLQLDQWQGHRSVIDQVYLDVLDLSDYVMADYAASGSGSTAVNLYVAWYDSQRAGQSAHSPRSCLPGGGWQITSLQQVAVANASMGATPLQVNRVIIENGAAKQLVYYWFQQRGRVITNEYMVKWYLFWDSLTRHRTDGALVRLVVPVGEGKTVQQAETELVRFTQVLAVNLEAFIPG